jgi:hypothetical protein
MYNCFISKGGTWESCSHKSECNIPLDMSERAIIKTFIPYHNTSEEIDPDCPLGYVPKF